MVSVGFIWGGERASITGERVATGKTQAIQEGITENLGGTYHQGGGCSEPVVKWGRRKRKRKSEERNGADVALIPEKEQTNNLKGGGGLENS